MPNASQQKWYGTGRRKDAVARVSLTPGTGKITVNHRDADEYFRRETLKQLLMQPLEVAEVAETLDVTVNAAGGGLAGQAGAVRHGIARALLEFNPELRVALKRQGFLTRDSRTVERKKYGRPGARKRFQFSKR